MVNRVRAFWGVFLLLQTFMMTLNYKLIFRNILTGLLLA